MSNLTPPATPAAPASAALDAKFAVFPWGNVTPSLLDKRITAVVREIEQLRVDIRTAAPGDPDFKMHVNLMSVLSNLGVDAQWLLRDYRAHLAKSRDAAPDVITP